MTSTPNPPITHANGEPAVDTRGRPLDEDGNLINYRGTSTDTYNLLHDILNELARLNRTSTEIRNGQAQLIGFIEGTLSRLPALSILGMGRKRGN